MKKQQLQSIKPRLTSVGIRCAEYATPFTRKGLALKNFADKWRSLARCGSLADYDHGVFLRLLGEFARKIFKSVLIGFTMPAHMQEIANR
jgi:hypothetical protein